jgi:hypothetical protein
MVDVKDTNGYFAEVECYGEIDGPHEDASFGDNYFHVRIESRRVLSPKKEDQFPLIFYFYSFNISKIQFNKIIIIKESNRLDVTDKLILEGRWDQSNKKYIYNGIIDIEYADDDIHSQFPIVIYETAITKKDEEYYVEYDFDVEFLNGIHENFNKTVRLFRTKQENQMFKSDGGWLFDRLFLPLFERYLRR